MEEALAGHPEILAAREGLAAAGFSVEETVGSLRPQAEFVQVLGRERTISPILRAQGIGQRSLTRKEQRFSFRQTLYDGNGTMNRTRAAGESRRARAWEVEEARLRVAFRAVAAFLEVLHQQEQVDLARGNIQRKAGIREKVEARSRGGVGRHSDLDQASSRLAQAETSLHQREAELEAARAAFQEAVGRSPEELELPRVPDLEVADSMPARRRSILQEHPALRRAERSLEASRLLSRSARASFRPRVDLDLGATRFDDIDGIPGENEDFTALLSLRQNLTSGGVFQARRERFEAEERRSRQIVAALNRRLERDLRSAWANLASARSNAALFRSSVDLELQVVEAFQKQFRLGKRTLFDLLNADDQLFRTRSSLLATRFAHMQAAYQVLASQGNLLEVIGSPWQEVPGSGEGNSIGRIDTPVLPGRDPRRREDP